MCCKNKKHVTNRLPLVQEDIDRAHRIGMEYTEKNSGKKSKIHNSEIEVTGSAKTILHFKDGKKKPGCKSFSVSVDLTKRCYLLLGEAKEFIKK